MAGKIPAIAMARTLVLDHISVLKLDEVADEDNEKARTVVVMDSDYVDSLRRAAEANE
jgi:hypothetical protein